MMFTHVRFLALVVAGALLPVSSAIADHHHGGGHGHGGVDVHIGGGGHYSGHSSSHHGFRHHSDWHYVVPHYDNHYHGTYYSDTGVNYYVPRTYVTQPGEYVAAKPIQIEFGGYAYVDDLSGRLERQVNQLCLDLYYNYRQNSSYRETYREAYQLLETVKYIHQKEHQRDRAEVTRRVNDLDKQFHHLQDEVSRWSRQPLRQIGDGGLQNKLETVEATLHHLANDVGVKGAHEEGSTSSSEATETAPPPEPVLPPEPVSPTAAPPLPPPSK